jgi:HEAT repeat protein
MICTESMGTATGCCILRAMGPLRARLSHVLIPAALLSQLVCAPAAKADAALEELLGAGIERPAYLGRFVRADDAQVAALIALYERADAPTHVRLRALSALGETQHVAAHALFQRLVRSAGASDGSDALHPARSVPVLTRALRGLRAAPEGLAPAELAPLLAHVNPAVRKAAVDVLAAQGGKAARSILAAHAATEQSPRVLRALSAPAK